MLPQSDMLIDVKTHNATSNLPECIPPDIPITDPLWTLIPSKEIVMSLLNCLFFYLELEGC